MYCIDLCIYSVYSICILKQVCMSTVGVVFAHTGRSHQYPNLQEIQGFKWWFCVWFAPFWFMELFQEYNPGMKQDIPVLWFRMRKSGKLLWMQKWYFKGISHLPEEYVLPSSKGSSSKEFINYKGIVAEHFWHSCLLGLSASVTDGSQPYVLGLICQSVFRTAGDR